MDWVTLVQNKMKQAACVARPGQVCWRDEPRFPILAAGG